MIYVFWSESIFSNTLFSLLFVEVFLSSFLSIKSASPDENVFVCLFHKLKKKNCQTKEICIHV